MLRRVLSLALVLALVTLSLPQGALADSQAGKTMDILFTHDLHSHVDPVIDQFGEEVGGYARIGAYIQDAKEENPGTIAVDAGDFSMGTLYQTVFSQDALEFRMLGAMGIDATTLGNHEFDYRPQGLAQMLQAAAESGDPLPRLLQGNIDWEQSPGQDTAMLRQAMETAGWQPYTLLERDGVLVALFGLFGESAAEDAPTSGLAFEEMGDAANQVIQQIREEADPDLIVCLSHGGTSSSPKDSEDQLLAKAAPDIDVIISGHSHTILETPIREGDTWIVSCGEYGAQIGSLSLEQGEDGRWNATDYQLVPIDSSLPSLSSVQDLAQSSQGHLTEYLHPFGFDSPQQVLAYNPYSFPEVSQLYEEQREQPLGNLIADSYRYAVQQAEGENTQPVAAAFVPVGVIRDTFRPGPITVAQAFQVSSLGIGPDGVAGYPLVSVWLTGKELRTVAEVDASVSLLMNAAQLQVSGVGFTYNPHRLLLDRVTQVWLVDDQGQRQELEDDRLYRVVAGLYSAQMLGTVNSKSYGLLSLVPKDAQGNPITDFEAHIIRDEQGSEVKEWAALASYLTSFPSGTDGLPTIPATYSETQGRKILVDDPSLTARLASPGKVSLILYGVTGGLLGIIVAVVLIVIWRRRKKRRLT